MKIKIHGRVIKVKFVDGDCKKMHPKKDRYNLGLTEHIEGVISIHKNMDEKSTRSTVIHELVHAFIWEYGYDVENEEAMCNFFGAHADRIMKLTDEIMEVWKG